MPSRTRSATRAASSAPVTLATAPQALHAPAANMRLTYLIGQLDRIVSRRLSETLAQCGLTLPQYTALSVLRARERATNAQLAERSFITPQSANEVVKTMETNGWVMRAADPDNRRVVLLMLTSAGKTLLARCDARVEQIERTMLAGLNDDTAQTLHALLFACVRNLRAG